MRSTRRRNRRPDPFASPEWVRSIFEQLKATYLLESTLEEAYLVKLLRAVRHVERYSATDTRRGRPSPWPREDLVKLGGKLAGILHRETSGRLSLATFVDHYLRILDFPSDVLESLENGKLNLFEAEQMARITPARLKTGAAQAGQKRAEILRAHLQSKASGERLRQRINNLLNPVAPERTSSVPASGADSDELEDFDPYDSTHLFWEEIKQLAWAFRNIRREDVTDELIEELIRASSSVWSVLQKIERRKNP